MEVNQLTGSGKGFFTVLLDRDTVELGTAPPEVQKDSLLSFIIRRFSPETIKITPMNRLLLSEIAEAYHGEVMDLLLLGLGAVDKSKTIWLSLPFVSIVYSGNSANLSTLLEAMLHGLQDAMAVSHPKNEALDLTRRMDDNASEIEALLTKIAAAKSE